jgi:hypothetical protein
MNELKTDLPPRMDSADTWIKNYKSLLEYRIEPMIDAQETAEAKKKTGSRLQSSIL